MAVQAFGWLSSKLGVDIAGRDQGATGTLGAGQAQGEPDQNQQAQQALAGAGPPQENFMASIGNSIFGESAGANAAPKDGLPEERNWFVYDDEKKMYVPTPEAPAHVHEEHREKVAAHERQKSGVSDFPDPPPPPPPMPMPGVAAVMAGQSPVGQRAQYADSGHFK